MNTSVAPPGNTTVAEKWLENTKHYTKEYTICGNLHPEVV